MVRPLAWICCIPKEKTEWAWCAATGYERIQSQICVNLRTPHNLHMILSFSSMQSLGITYTLGLHWYLRVKQTPSSFLKSTLTYPITLIFTKGTYPMGDQQLPSTPTFNGDTGVSCLITYLWHHDRKALYLKKKHQHTNAHSKNQFICKTCVCRKGGLWTS